MPIQYLAITPVYPALSATVAVAGTVDCQQGVDLILSVCVCALRALMPWMSSSAIWPYTEASNATLSLPGRAQAGSFLEGWASKDQLVAFNMAPS